MFGTHLGAKPAPHAALGTHRTHFLASSEAVGAGDVHLRACGDALDQPLGTGGDALAASDALCPVHLRIARVAHVYGVGGTGVRARTHAQTSPRTHFAPAAQQFHAAAVAVAHILILVVGGVAAVASDVKKRCGVTPLAHLSCVTATRQSITEYVRILTGDGIENVLALRGDIPDGVDPSGFEFEHASDLVAMLKEISGLCVGGACYPEGHPESASLAQDIEAVRIKVAAGCDFLTTQMFFDNNVLYNYMFKLRDKGVNVPVVAGIMPITNAKSIKRICKLSGIVLPQRFRMIVDRYGDDPDAMKQAGIAYATEQIIDLYANGIKAVHVYVMNKPDVAAKIKENLSSIVK